MFIEPSLTGERRGWIEVICGSMFSGKTEELIRRMTRAQIARQKLQVFKPAIEYGAAAVVLVHNHPSGISTPSQSDIQITAQIVAAGKVLGISLLDHVVVTRDSFTSIPVEY